MPESRTSVPEVDQDWPTPQNLLDRVAEGTAEFVYGRMPHCPKCGGALVAKGSVGFYGDGQPAFYETCARACQWGQEVRCRVSASDGVEA